jgi:hypothetical protein
MECLVLKCPKPDCGHVWPYTGGSTSRVACPSCNAYVTVRRNMVGAAEITYVVTPIDPEAVLERMESRPKPRKGIGPRYLRQDPTLVEALKQLVKKTKTK